jgi:hypothetical protein
MYIEGIVISVRGWKRNGISSGSGKNKKYDVILYTLLSFSLRWYVRRKKGEKA